jgi:hypothetical protein
MKVSGGYQIAKSAGADFPILLWEGRHTIMLYIQKEHI